MNSLIKKIGSVLVMSLVTQSGYAGEIIAKKVSQDLSKLPDAKVFDGAQEEVVDLTAQPMAIPRPKDTTTPKLKVKAVNDGKWLAFLLRWSDTELSEAGKLGAFSDAVAIQFPVKDNKVPPPIMMGAKGNPVHILHWRAQYQVDKHGGMKNVKDIYPNMNIDIYPLEFNDMGNLKGINDQNREVFSHGKAAGNAQSFRKEKGVDEIFAEGFGSSSVVENIAAEAEGEWKNGEWSVVIARPLKRENGSMLEAGGDSFVAFAVWQGGKDEVGSRKSLTLSWTPIKIAE